MDLTVEILNVRDLKQLTIFISIDFKFALAACNRTLCINVLNNQVLQQYCDTLQTPIYGLVNLVEVHTKFNQHSDKDTGLPRPILVINDFSKNIQGTYNSSKIKNLHNYHVMANKAKWSTKLLASIVCQFKKKILSCEILIVF